MNLRRVVCGCLHLEVLALASLLVAGQAHAAPAGDPSAGSDVFASECSDCHSVKEGKNKKGPSLFAVIGRKSGSITDFEYSDAMKGYGVVWSVDKIDAYITKPKAVVPGGKMKYDGLADAKARADLLAYLATQK